MLDGTSLWPTVFLRGMGCILSGYFIWRALRDLHDNLESMATGMNLNPHPASMQDQFMLKNRDGMWTGDSQRSGSPSPGEEAWEHYIRRERLWPRIGWAALWTTLMVGVAFLVLIPMFGMPVYGYRSHFADRFYYWTVLSFWLSMQFLTFIVFDATWSCLRVVHKLSGETTWPPETLDAYDRRMSLSEVVLVHEWIDRDFLGKRTRCIGSLIYLPFIVIALLIVSRSSIFANYAPSATILASQLISLFVVFACAIMLWWAANSARDTARDKLKEVIVRLKKS